MICETKKMRRDKRQKQDEKRRFWDGKKDKKGWRKKRFWDKKPAKKDVLFLKKKKENNNDLEPKKIQFWDENRRKKNMKNLLKKEEENMTKIYLKKTWRTTLFSFILWILGLGGLRG